MTPVAGRERESAATALELAAADPYPVYARLRQMASVLPVDWPGLGRFCVVPRYREALTIFSDRRFIRSVDRLAMPDGRQTPRREPNRGFGPDLLELDPPDHTRLRRLVGKAFTSAMVERLGARIGQLADQCLDRARPSGQIELISEYATVIPITIISELLGMPVGDIGKFRDFIHTLSFSQMLGQRSAAIDAQRSQFVQQLHALFAARRESPRDDLVSALVAAEHDGDRLSADELIGMVYLLLIAGFLTTVNEIGNATLTLLRHPAELERLRRDPSLIDNAVEELLRFDSPLTLSVICYASTDIEMSGVRIARGTPVRALIAAANRDETQFPAPDRLDLARNPCAHLAFGHGVHYCLGAALARLEIKIALSRLIERAPNLRTTDAAELKWLTHPMFRGLQQLPLRF